MPVYIGQQLGEYRLIQFLGRGSYAEVYLGRHIHLGTRVAIKILHNQFIDQEDDFKREARQAASLVHPHIVRVNDFAIDRKKQPPIPYLVMEYAPGGSILHHHPRGARLPSEKIILYVKQIADALDFAHAHKVIHRDVKPENILVGENDTLLLSDFGIAVVIGQEGNAQAAGTKTYIAPEQILNNPQPQSDQYALGIIVYEWLCGFPPFSAKNKPTDVILEAHLKVEAPSLSSTGMHIQPGVEQVMQRVLAKKPYQRFATAGQFAEELERAFQDSKSASGVLTLKPSSTSEYVSASPAASTFIDPAAVEAREREGKPLPSPAAMGMIPPPMPKQPEPKPRKDWSKPTLKLDIDYLLAGRGMAFRVTGLILTLMSALLVGVVFPGSSVWILCLLAALPLSLLYALVSNRGATLVLAVLLTCYWVTVGEVVNGATLRSSPVVIGILVFCVSFAPLAWYAFVKIPR